jgi:serine protease AprX
MSTRGAAKRRWAAAGLTTLLALIPSHGIGTAAAGVADYGFGSYRGGDSGTWKAKLAPSLVRMTQLSVAEQAGTMVDVVVAYESMGAVSNMLAHQAGGQVNGDFARLPFHVMRVPAEGLKVLAKDPGVRYVATNAPVFSSSQAGRQTARVPGSTSSLQTANTAWKGSTVPVAIVDTGVAQHWDLYAPIAQFDFVGGAPGTPMDFSDPYGHGTHIAGMVGGDGSYSYSAKYQGVSTQAKIISLRVLDGEGRGNMSDVLRALDWILTTGIPEYGIRVANLSLGKGVEEGQDLDPLVQAVNAVWDAGVVVVVAAGNHGQSGHYTITSPGNSRKVITVGSLTDNSTGTTYYDDRVSTFSSRGPTLFDHVLKPDLIAPGNKIVAPYSENSRLGQLLPSSRVLCGFSGSCSGPRYLQLSGTSMAAALVSGGAARMLDKDPSLSPATVKARLMKSARKMAGDPTKVGAGVLNVDAAMNATGTVTSALSPLMTLSADRTVVYVQDTGGLWGNSQWAASYLWADAYLWSMSASGYLWSSGSLWADSSLWADGYLWSSGFLWSEAVAPASVDVEDPDEVTP